MDAEFDFRKLKGRIVEICGSQKEFAKAVGLTPTTVSYKLNGKKSFTYGDIVKWCEVLQIGIDEIGRYFFTSLPKAKEGPGDGK